MAIEQVYTFFVRCFHQRKDATTLANLLPAAIRRWQITSTEIAASFTKGAVEFCSVGDPLIATYVHVIIKDQHAQISDILIACMQKWKASNDSGASQIKQHLLSLTQVITSLNVCLLEHKSTQQQARTCLALCGRWLEALFGQQSSNDSSLKIEQSLPLTNALVACLVTIMNTKSAQASLNKLEKDKNDTVNKLLRRVVQFSTVMTPEVSTQLMAEASKYPALAEIVLPEADSTQVAELATLQFESSIIQTPIIPTRSSMYCLLYSKVGHFFIFECCNR